MAQRLLSGEGPLYDDGGDVFDLQQEVIQLTSKVARLEQVNRQLDEALRLERIKSQTAEAGVRELKAVLSPLHQALLKLWREFSQMDFGPEAVAGAPQFDPKWTAWLDKFGKNTAPARVIQAILDHGPLSRSQLRQAIKGGWSTVDGATARLSNLQLIEKSGDRWNLKG